MPLLPYKDKMPQVHEEAFIAEGAMVIGDVTIGAGTGVWYNAVIRGDFSGVTIGNSCNIQDNCVVHSDRATPTVLGDGVTIAHGAVIHGCVIEEGSLIAINATVLSGARIGAGSIVGAGSVVGEKAVVPPRSLVLGTPGKVIRQLTDEQVARAGRTADLYAALAQEHKERQERG